MPLDAKTVEYAKKRKKPYRLSDGDGLLLQVNKSGSKDWLVRVTIAGKRRDMGIGGWPVLSLAEARVKAQDAKRDIKAGIDPIAKQREAKEAARAARMAKEEEDKRIFEAALEAYLKAEAPSWKTPKTAKSWRASLEQHAAPIMRLPVGKIGGEDVGNVLSPIWHDKPVMAGKVRRRIAAVLDYAARKGWRDEKNPAHASRLKDLELSKQAEGKNQPSLPWARLPAFMAALDAEAGMAPLALRFLILTALRSSEGRACRWNWVSFDEDGPTLTIPPEAMKGRKTEKIDPHRVPLSPAALETLARAYGYALGTKPDLANLPKLAALAGDARIFPNARRDGPLSDAAVSKVIREMHKETPWKDRDGRRASVHGFRASFATWVDDVCPGEHYAREKALAHEIPDGAVSAAYRRSDLFARRVPLMAAWAEHCCKPPAPVVSLPKARAKRAR
jgi:integrase